MPLRFDWIWLAVSVSVIHTITLKVMPSDIVPHVSLSFSFSWARAIFKTYSFHSYRCCYHWHCEQAVTSAPTSSCSLFPLWPPLSLPPEKDLQVPQGPEQPQPVGGGAEGDPGAGGHGPHLPAAGRVHPPGPPAHHLHPAGWGRARMGEFRRKAALRCYMLL